MNFCWAEGEVISSRSAHCFTPDVFESLLATFCLAIKYTHSSGNLDTFFQSWFTEWKKWSIGKFWVAAHRVEVNDGNSWAIVHHAVIIYWKVGGFKQQLSRETNQLKKIVSYRFPDTDPGIIINYKINVMRGTWDHILSMPGFERFWLCQKMWMLQELSSCLHKRLFYKLKQSWFTHATTLASSAAHWLQVCSVPRLSGFYPKLWNREGGCRK